MYRVSKKEKKKKEKDEYTTYLLQSILWCIKRGKKAKEEKGENKNTRFSMAAYINEAACGEHVFVRANRMRKTRRGEDPGRREKLVGSTKLGARFALRGSSS